MSHPNVQVLRQDSVHLNVMASDLTVLSTIGALSTRVVLSGDLDLVTAPALDLVIDQALHAGPPNVDVDLARIGFLGAAGLAALHRGDELCRARGGRLSLDRVDRWTGRLLDVAGLERLVVGRSAGARMP